MAITMKMVHTHTPTAGRAVTLGTVEKTITQTGDHHDAFTQNIGTTEESIVVSTDITEGYAYIENKDGTNFVDIGFTTAVYGIRLKAGENCWLRLVPAVSIFAKADTAAVDVQIVVFDD